MALAMNLAYKEKIKKPISSQEGRKDQMQIRLETAPKEINLLGL